MNDKPKPPVFPDLQPRRSVSQDQKQADVFAALNALALSLEERAVEAVSWYLRHKGGPRFASRLLRGLAIAFGVSGGLAPLLSGADLSGEVWGMTWTLPDTDHWGYILIALAGAALLTDRYFGFSSSWMRYMTTQMALQRALEKFQLSWAVWRIQVKGNTPGDGQQTAAIALLTAFGQEIGDLVDQEFQSWVAQFKEQLAELQAAISKDKTERRPGNLVVGIHADSSISGPADIYLDNRLVRQTDSGSVLLSALNPGSHLVAVKANGGALQGSTTVMVEAGQTSEANIGLKSTSPSAAA
jgi:hypothetical protein